MSDSGPGAAGRNIILCCDGTGNQYGANNTNVVLTYEASIEDAGQLRYYDPGLGTFDPGSPLAGDAETTFGKLQKKGREIWGGATGAGLQTNVHDAYLFLMRNFQEGDRVFIFGFSRGAHTARVLAGMLHRVGLLIGDKRNLVDYAYRTYKHADDDIAAGFKNTFSRVCKPRFLGVWDTVATIGFYKPQKFSNNILNPDVGRACHAISIDEARGKFPASLWDEVGSDDAPTRISQVWFAGVHSDIGGWYRDRGLSHITFKWMMEQARASGIRLRDGWDAELRPDPRAAQHESWGGIYKVVDLFRRRHREIPEPMALPDGGQLASKIHQSVLDRLGADVAVHDDDEEVERRLKYAPRLPGTYDVVE